MWNSAFSKQWEIWPQQKNDSQSTSPLKGTKRLIWILRLVNCQNLPEPGQSGTTSPRHPGVRIERETTQTPPPSVVDLPTLLSFSDENIDIVNQDSEHPNGDVTSEQETDVFAEINSPKYTRLRKPIKAFFQFKDEYNNFRVTLSLRIWHIGTGQSVYARQGNRL